LKELEKRLAKEPGNLGLKVQVASLLRDAGRSAEAVELFRQVALAYRDAGRKQQASVVCRSILEIAPHDEASRALLADLTAPPPAPFALPPAPKDEPRLSPPPERHPAPSRPAQMKIPTPVPKSPVVPASEQTPLPKPLPYHVADPTTGQKPRLTPGALIDTEPTIPDAVEKPREDLAAELDTRPVRKLDSSEIRKLSQPMPTVEYPRVELDDDARTPVRDSDEITRPHDKLPDKD